MQKYFASGRCDEVKKFVSAREELFALMKSLSAFTKGNILHDNYKGMAACRFPVVVLLLSFDSQATRWTP